MYRSYLSDDVARNDSFAVPVPDPVAVVDRRFGVEVPVVPDPVVVPS